MVFPLLELPFQRCYITIYLNDSFSDTPHLVQEVRYSYQTDNSETIDEPSSDYQTELITIIPLMIAFIGLPASIYLLSTRFRTKLDRFLP